MANVRAFGFERGCDLRICEPFLNGFRSTSPLRNALVQDYRPLVPRPSPVCRRDKHIATVRPEVRPPAVGTSQGCSLGGAPALDLAAIYAAHFVDVSRWVRSLGANEADVEDLTQEVFIIFRRKLGMFDGRNLGGFLYRIAQRTARDHRRSAWFRASTRSQIPIDWHALATAEPTGLEVVEELHRRRTLRSALASMSEKRRTTLVLFEIEGYSGEEIARIQSVPVRTVWTRLHHARKDLLRIVAELLPAHAGGKE